MNRVGVGLRITGWKSKRGRDVIRGARPECPAGAQNSLTLTITLTYIDIQTAEE